jgi:hypothetical protein
MSLMIKSQTNVNDTKNDAPASTVDSLATK